MDEPRYTPHHPFSCPHCRATATEEFRAALWAARDARVAVCARVTRLIDAEVWTGVYVPDLEPGGMVMRFGTFESYLTAPPEAGGVGFTVDELLEVTSRSGHMEAHDAVVRALHPETVYCRRPVDPRPAIIGPHSHWMGDVYETCPQGAACPTPSCHPAVAETVAEPRP